MIIDSHHHLWQYSAEDYGWIGDDMSSLRRDFLLDELRDVAADHGVNRFVTVQARQSLEETRWLLGLSDQEPRIGAVVGWAPLAEANVSDVLDRFSEHPRLRGIRHVVQDEPDDRFLLGEAFNRGVEALTARRLVYDILIYARQLPAAIEFVDRHPEQTFVLDHVAKPTIRESAFDEAWERGFRELARRENVWCKVSGMVTEVRDPAWRDETLRRYWQVALEAFSPRRLMFGSDWPVCLCKAGYGDWLGTVRRWAEDLSDHERTELFSRNAVRVYGIDPLSDETTANSPP